MPSRRAKPDTVPQLPGTGDPTPSDRAPDVTEDVPWTAAPFVPSAGGLDVLTEASRACRGCPLYANAIQTVFGEGRPDAPLILVGEQPGDNEDKQGHPFVGPAGGVLWRCLEEAGATRDDVYATNAVKHFKNEPRGKRRMHKKPTTAEVEACHPWLDAELRLLAGRTVVCLGATAARAVLGRTVPIAASRGNRFQVGERVGGRDVFVTYHPSAVLRADEAAAEVRAALVADLAAAWRHAGGS
jgi:DNA polymerase